MNLRNLFRRPSPTLADCAREMALSRRLSDRERIRARARLMNLEMGREIPEALK